MTVSIAKFVGAPPTVLPHSGVCKRPPFANIPIDLFLWNSLVPGLGTSLPPLYIKVWLKFLSRMSPEPPGCLSVA